MKHRARLSPTEQQQEKVTPVTGQSQHRSAQEFATAEALLRFDAAQTPVPPEIAARLQQSASQLPPPPRRSWWQNLFGH